jgi:hypothetical protein
VLEIPTILEKRVVRYAAAFALLVAFIALSRSFGATWDERALQALGEQVWDYFMGRRSYEEIDVSFGFTRIYGAFVEVISVAAQRALPFDIYVVRHAVNSVFGWAGVIVAFLMARRLFGPRAGWLAAALLLCMPRYIGDSMNNTKDIPFAVLMFAAAYFIISVQPRYPYVSWGHALKLAIAIALAINVRSMGLALLGYTAIALALAVIVARDWSPARLAATAGRFAFITVVALVAGTAFWPWGQRQPLVRPFQAFFMASGFSWGNPSLFRGEYLPSTDLPWHYLPTWLGISLPLVVIVGTVLSIARLARRDDPVLSRIRLAAVFALVLLPGTYAIVRHLTLYDSIRHMYFIVPPFAVLAAAGWDMLLASSRRQIALASAAVLAVGLAEPILFQIRNHPNQTVYFSPVVGGPKGAFGRYDMDYWGNCMLQAVEWSASEAERAQMPVVITANAWEIAVVDILRFPSLAFRLQRHGGAHLNVTLLKGSPRDVLGISGNPDILHRVTTADGTPLCLVMPGPEYPQLAERIVKVGRSANSEVR